MKFKNKITNEIKEPKNYTQLFAYTHNSNWEKIVEEKEPTIAEIKAKLEELKIDYAGKTKKEELLALLPRE